MAFSDLLDHTVRVRRPTESYDNPLRVLERAYPVVGTYPAAVNRTKARIGDAGPGLAPIGDRVVYMEASADVEARDILELMSGPDAPEQLEIDRPPTRPRGHHTELICLFYRGTLPAVVES